MIIATSLKQAVLNHVKNGANVPFVMRDNPRKPLVIAGEVLPDYPGVSFGAFRESEGSPLFIIYVYVPKYFAERNMQLQ